MQAVAVTLYDIGLSIYRFGLSIASLFFWKAALWISGRSKLPEEIEKFSKLPGGPTIWIHCASLGEFEQGRPVLEALRNNYPEARILLTFFSPSGYEVRKSYDKATKVMYLPLDHPKRSYDFVNTIQPELAIFVRYEYWYHYLSALKQRKVPTILISAKIDRSSVFFKPWGLLHRKMLHLYDKIFVQDEISGQNLQKLGIDQKVEVAGDSRFDRVLAISRIAPQLQVVSEFKHNRKLMVAGSTWEADEKLLFAAFEDLRSAGYALVIAPHDIQSFRLKHVERLFRDYKLVRYSAWKGKADLDAEILLVDNIGKLSAIYRYADVAYIGGGFNRSVHNILEAAVYGVPVFFGPKYKHINEAIDLVNQGGAFPVRKAKELVSKLKVLDDNELYEKTARSNADYVRSGAGATSRIMEFLKMLGF